MVISQPVSVCVYEIPVRDLFGRKMVERNKIYQGNLNRGPSNGQESNEESFTQVTLEGRRTKMVFFHLFLLRNE